MGGVARDRGVCGSAVARHFGPRRGAERPYGGRRPCPDPSAKAHRSIPPPRCATLAAPSVSPTLTGGAAIPRTVRPSRCSLRADGPAPVFRAPRQAVAAAQRSSPRTSTRNAAAATPARNLPWAPCWKRRRSRTRDQPASGAATAARRLRLGAVGVGHEREADLDAGLAGDRHRLVLDGPRRHVAGDGRPVGDLALERRDLGEQRPQRPVGAGLDDREADALACRRLGDQVGPGRVALREHVAGEDLADARLGARQHVRGHARDPSLGVGLVDRRDAHVEPVGARVRRDDRVRGPQHRLAQELRDVRFADPVGPQRPDHAAVAQAALVEARHDPVAPHRAQLARRAWQQDGHAPVRPVDPPAGRRAVGIRDRRRRRDQPGLLEVDLRERDAAPLEEPAQPGLLHRVDRRDLADRGRERLAGEVVGRRAEAAGGDDEVDALERLRERRGDERQVVRERDDPPDGDAAERQRPGQLAAVRVARLARRQLAADGKELGDVQDAVLRPGRIVIPGAYPTASGSEARPAARGPVVDLGRSLAYPR